MKPGKIEKQFSTAAWQGRLFRAVAVGLAGLGTIKGLTPDTGWLDFAVMLRPGVVFPWLLSIFMAATTSGSK